MKIKLNTSKIFVAEEVPWLIAIMLVLFIFCFVAPGLAMVFDGVWVGLIFAFVGGGMGFAALCVFVERLQVILDQKHGLITLRRRTVLKHQQKTLPLDAFLRAETQVTTSRKEGRTRQLYRPVLVVSENGDETIHPVTEVYSSGARAERLVQAINAWAAKAMPKGTQNSIKS